MHAATKQALFAACRFPAACFLLPALLRTAPQPRRLPLSLCPFVPSCASWSLLRCACAVRLFLPVLAGRSTTPCSRLRPVSPPSLYRCAGGGNKYAAFLTEVAQRTGRLFAEWHRVGFTHGVLNTDNMSIMGDTIGGLGVEGGEFISDVLGF